MPITFRNVTRVIDVSGVAAVLSLDVVLVQWSTTSSCSSSRRTSSSLRILTALEAKHLPEMESRPTELSCDPGQGHNMRLRKDCAMALHGVLTEDKDEESKSQIMLGGLTT